MSRHRKSWNRTYQERPAIAREGRHGSTILQYACQSSTRIGVNQIEAREKHDVASGAQGEPGSADEGLICELYRPSIVRPEAR